MSYMKESVGKVQLNFEYYSGSDYYSDGEEIEKRLLDIAQNCNKDEIKRIVSETDEWPLYYHLSDVRSNILEWVSIDKNHTVLEIGSGCGAITGILAEKGKKVTCIELSKNRSLINAHRHKDKDNIEIIVGNFEDIYIDEKYDYITLIGVYEYAASYIKAEDPYNTFIHKIKKYLKPSGKLIIAIENKYGLKYWAGCKEDHLGIYFKGIEGYTFHDKIKTFSRSELTHIMNNNGLENHTFYYPYPDYKFPYTIYSDQCLPRVNSLNKNNNNFDAERLTFFDESKVFNNIIEDNLFSEFSNSFLLIASNDNLVSKDELIFCKYPQNRKDEFMIKTKIVVKSNGIKSVIKEAFSESSQKHINDMYNNYSLYRSMYIKAELEMVECYLEEGKISFKYVEGNTFEELLNKNIQKNGIDGLLNMIKSFSDYLNKFNQVEKFEISKEFIKVFGPIRLNKDTAAIKGGNVDLIASNIIISDKFNVIDYEWLFDFLIPIKYIVYRMILCYMSTQSEILEFSQKQVLLLLGFSEDEIIEYDKMEKSFIKYTSNDFKSRNESKLLKENLNVQDQIRQYKEILKPKYFQLFFDCGEGFSEANSLKIEIEENSQNIYQVEINLPMEIKNLRFDPSEEACIISLIEIGVDFIPIDLESVKTNGVLMGNGFIVFDDNDPQIILEGINQDSKKLRLEFKYSKSSNHITYEFLKAKVVLEKLESQNNKILSDKIELNSKINSFIADNAEVMKKNDEFKSEIIELKSMLADQLELKKINNGIKTEYDQLTQKIIEIEKDRDAYKIYLESTLIHVNKLESIIMHNKNRKISSKLKKLLSITKIMIVNPKYIIKGISSLINKGPKYVFNKAKLINSSSEYNPINNETSREYKENVQSVELNNFARKPLISIVMPVYDVEPKWLLEAIRSIENQNYENWELCIVDDYSTNEETVLYLNNLSNSKIKLSRNEKNLGISATTNNAIAMATGEYIAFMDNDDVIEYDALFEIIKAINETDADVFYSDEDKIDVMGNRKFPFCKPDWSLDLLRSQMYICHFLVVRKELILNIEGFRSNFDGSQDYDLMLRLSEVTNRIVHVPKVLYSWRELPTSTSLNPGSKPYAHKAGLRALQDHLDRSYGEGQAHAFETENLFVFDVRYPMPKDTFVSIILPMKDNYKLTKECVKSIIDLSSYQNFEIIIMNNNSVEKDTFSWFESLKSETRIRVIDASYDFNWSMINNHGIREAKGDVFIFLNNDTLVISEDWIERLSENALRSDIGTVGGLLLFEEGTIQHAGVVLGMNGWADHVFKGMEPVHFGSPYVSPVLTRNVLASTGACLGISRKTIEEIGGFDEQFIICGSDVEISLRAIDHGKANLYNPFIRLYHLESKSRDSFIPEIDFEMSKLHYSKYLKSGDPYFNPNLDYYSSSPKYKV